MATARIGATPKGGICRLTLTDLDRQVRDWFKAQAQALGCSVTIDDMGTMFARRPGQRADVPPIAMGSHLDTQPTGGKFDGALGVLAALEALRTLVRAGYETFAPIEVVNWTNEEGARFAPADDRLRRLCRRVRARLGGRAPRPQRRKLRRCAGEDRLSRAAAQRRPQALGLFRGAYRAGPLSGGRRQGHRSCHRRAGHALVRNDHHRPGQPCRHHADAAPARCAARRRAPGRSGQCARARDTRPRSALSACSR